MPDAELAHITSRVAIALAIALSNTDEAFPVLRDEDVNSRAVILTLRSGWQPRILRL